MAFFGWFSQLVGWLVVDLSFVLGVENFEHTQWSKKKTQKAPKPVSKSTFFQQTKKTEKRNTKIKQK